MIVRGGALRASTVLARQGSDMAIFDTGFAHHAASLVAALAAEGVTPAEVTLVFNTHLHVDHSHNNALFHNARIYCSARDLAWARGFHQTMARFAEPTPADVFESYPEMASAVHDSKIARKILGVQKMFWDDTRWGRPDQFVWLEEAAPPSGIKVINTPGHSPFHVSYLITTNARPVLVAGDALLVRGENHSLLQLMPPFDLSTYLHSQELINRFDGLVVPGHDEPFDNYVADASSSSHSKNDVKPSREITAIRRKKLTEQWVGDV